MYNIITKYKRLWRKYMAVSYKKLWHLLLDRNMNKSDLERMSGISHYSITKMGKDQDVTTEILSKICNTLDCKIDDILEIIND